MDAADSRKQKIQMAALALLILALAGWEFYSAWFVHHDLFWLFLDPSGSVILMGLGVILIVGISFLFRSRTDEYGHAPQAHADTGEDYEGSLAGPGPEIPLETDSYNGRLSYYAMAIVLIFFLSGTLFAFFHTPDVILWYAGSVLVCSVLAFLLVRDWGTRWGINLLMSVLLAFFIGIMRMMYR